MAARKKKYQTEDCRAKIKTTLLLNRATQIAMGELTVDAVQVSALKLILNKVLPDLKAIELTGDQDNPLNVNHTVIQRTIVDPRDTNT